MTKLNMFIGTYTRPVQDANGVTQPSRGRGIYRVALDLQTGGLGEAELLVEGISPSFICFGKDGRHLYAVNEAKNFAGGPGGGVSAYAIDANDQTMSLHFENSRPSRGENPCHIVTSPDGKYLFISNYSGGNFTVYALEPSGRIGAEAMHTQFHGSSIHPQRQNAPYVHSVTFSKDGKHVYVADLGTDRMVCYRYDPQTADFLKEITASTYHAEPGSGPRHCVFSHDGRFAYLVNELNHSVTMLAYDSDNGQLTALQAISTLPEAEADIENTCADIQLSPDGQYLYASNRGHDSLAIYTVDGETGRLSSLGFQAVGGQTPRSFLIEPNGRFLLCTTQNSDQLISFAIDPATGKLSKVTEIEVGSPVCVKFCPF